MSLLLALTSGSDPADQDLLPALVFSSQTFFAATVTPVSGGVGGGGGAHGVDSYRKNRPIVIDGHEDDLRAEIITQDDEILAVIMSAVACGALQ